MAHFRAMRVPLVLKILQGFTLLELLVTLTLFAIMAMMAYGGLNAILVARAQTDQHAEQLARLQMAFSWLGRDIEQQVGRPIRDQYGDRQRFIQGSFSQMEFTRTGWRNPAQQQRSSLQRVAYHVEDDTLWRFYWRMLDRAQGTQPIKIELLNNVKGMQLRYWDNNLQWHEEWPPANWLDTGPSEKANLSLALRAIEVRLIVTGWGDLSRLFRVPSILEQ